MFASKLKKITLPLCVGLLSALLFPALAQAELGGSGGIAARAAAEQKAAKEKKLAEKKRKAEEAQSTGSQQGSAPAAESKPAETQEQKPAGQ